MSSEERPLSRWSRRKAEQRSKQGSAAPAIEEAPTAAPPATTDAAPGESPAPDLPDIESLTSESDFAQFMAEGVPKHLRNLALRKLWASDPAFNVIDEMIEYGEDFTEGGALIANLKDAFENVKEETSETEDSVAAESADGEEPTPADEETAEDAGGQSTAEPDPEDGETDSSV